VAGEQGTVELGPFAHVLLAAVMRDERDPPLLPGHEVTVVGCHPPRMPGRCCRHGTRGLAARVGRWTFRWPGPPVQALRAVGTTEDWRRVARPAATRMRGGARFCYPEGMRSARLLLT